MGRPCRGGPRCAEQRAGQCLAGLVALAVVAALVGGLVSVMVVLVAEVFGGAW
ncbi:hypothetical protein FB384_004925 [Prauserella sediminis]|uniref:Uncharacterized protein n=1 Tax=Prauserella sediminis TaxID=577680 RepID=A0A839Y110_9PSEU|nr:hypothetical protein [Prauserella sediminis]MBB3665966.1 hypothetical protein [Prauserella sediminis]